MYLLHPVSRDKSFGIGQGWWNFWRTQGQIFYKLRRNTFACQWKYHHHHHHHHHRRLLYAEYPYTIPETNHVPRGYIVAARCLCCLWCLYLWFLRWLLFFYASTFRSMCAVPNMAAFCSSLTSCFPGISLTYFLNDLEMVPVAPIITGITLVLNSTCSVFLM